VRTHSTLATAAWDVWRTAAAQSHLALDPRAISRFRARTMLLETAAWPKDVFYEVSRSEKEEWRRTSTYPDPSPIAPTGMRSPPCSAGDGSVTKGCLL
jgi:hypothetical protein